MTGASDLLLAVGRLIRGYVFEICNITHLYRNIKIAIARKFDAMCITEHSIPNNHKYLAGQKVGKKHRLHLTDLDPEKVANVGGVAFLQTGNKDIIVPNIKKKPT